MTLNRRGILAHGGALGGLAVIGFPILTARPAFALDETEAEAHIKKAVDQVLALVQADGSAAEKAAKLKTIMERSAAMPQIARFAAGLSWREMNADQQKRYTDAFSHFLATVYARRFQDYAGQQVKFGRVRNAGKKGFLVETSVTQPSAAPVAVSWLVNDRPGKTVIADIIIEGVSMVVTQRDEINGMLDARGGDVEKLIEALKAA